MGGGVFNVIKKVASVAIPAALAFSTGGTSAALLSAGGGFLSSALAPKAPKSSAVTGVTQTASQAAADTSTTTPTETAEEAEKKKRLALNAAGSSGNTTSPLGVTAPATVTKRNLLGL